MESMLLYLQDRFQSFYCINFLVFFSWYWLEGEEDKVLFYIIHHSLMKNDILISSLIFIIGLINNKVGVSIDMQFYHLPINFHFHPFMKYSYRTMLLVHEDKSLYALGMVYPSGSMKRTPTPKLC